MAVSCVLVLGPRRSGKTTLIQTLQSLAYTTTIFVEATHMEEVATDVVPDVAFVMNENEYYDSVASRLRAQGITVHHMHVSKQFHGDVSRNKGVMARL